jgi:hypothetical protein
MSPEAAAELNASARVRQLIDLTDRLTEQLTVEAAAFEARRPQDAAATVARTSDLANTYRRESAQVKANPSVLAAAPAAERKALIAATEAFEAILSRHAAAVEAALGAYDGALVVVSHDADFLAALGVRRTIRLDQARAL